jgi:hypothetical protein
MVEEYTQNFAIERQAQETCGYFVVKTGSAEVSKYLLHHNSAL